MNSSTTNNTNSSTATDEAQEKLHQPSTIETIVENEDWGGMIRMLKEEEEEDTSSQQQNKTTSITQHASHTNRIFEFIHTSNNYQLMLEKLLKNQDNDKAKELLLMLITLGGQEFVMEKCSFQNSDTIFQRTLSYRTLLHAALELKLSFDVVSKMVEAGGNKLVMQKDYDGWNSLYIACRHNATIDIVLLLIEVGGKALVMEKSVYGANSLQHALESDVPIDVLSKIVEVGGEALVMEKNIYFENSLHCACERASNRYQLKDILLGKALLNILTQYDSAKILTHTNERGMTPLQHFIANDYEDDDDNDDNDWWDRQARTEKKEKGRFLKQLIDNSSLLLSKGIELQVEGEYGIGGLFTSTSQRIRGRIYENWDNIVVPALEQVIMALPPGRYHLPILQALIINKAPPHTIKSTAKRIVESVNTADSFSRYPIDLAIHRGLAWDGGMKEILEGSNVSILEQEDASTGLYPFMAATSWGKRKRNDFDSVFHLIKASPKLVQWFGDRSNEDEHGPRKRRRCD